MQLVQNSCFSAEFMLYVLRSFKKAFVRDFNPHLASPMWRQLQGAATQVNFSDTLILYIHAHM
ncbi:hypothetical protein Hdeb2414_s0011g00362871 [Helianthus debilis subsp. tardiflorus]